MKSRDADDHAADELSEDRRLAEPLRDLAERFRGDEDRDEREKELGDVHGVWEDISGRAQP